MLLEAASFVQQDHGVIEILLEESDDSKKLLMYTIDHRPFKGSDWGILSSGLTFHQDTSPFIFYAPIAKHKRMCIIQNNKDIVC